ncbi:rCG41405 [Rattus norvegicus]|nr:rCG41405 [Rattus norvegicus]
MIWKDF